MATDSNREWVKFFAGCGLPDDVATIYALIFAENRIRKNMLLDLNKEYLRDMGITVMGDVIAILKNAKVVHEKYYRAQILNDNVNSNNVTVNSKESQKTNSKKSTPSKRMLEHFTRKYTSLSMESPSDVQVIVENNKQNSCPAITSVQGSTVKTAITRKKIEVSINNPVRKETSQLGSLKISRVLQGNEEKDKIRIVPKTIERSKKLIEQAKKRQTKTVFDRLGESSVTSTTSEFVSSNSVSCHPNDTSKDKNSSVFARLGEKASLVSSTSSSGCDSQLSTKDQLPYAGVFKLGSATKKAIPSTTMRADNEQKKSTVKINLKKPVSVKKRLGAEGGRPQVVQNSIKTAKRQPISFSAEEKQLKPSVIKLKNKSHVEQLDLEKREAMVKNNLLGQRIQLGQKRAIVSSTTKTPISSTNINRVNLDSSESDGASPSKKVRFGGTTHRLIPSTTMPAESTSNVKNYPKLTMVINNNNVSPRENLVNLRNARIGSLNSDNMRGKISMSERIGQKGKIELRLKKRPLASSSTASTVPLKKFCSVRDRLG